ncbi:MAG: MarR family winged helix-turn-helix transcriptional regulator [Gammaproteobacteria bacterium]|nr:MarR family winged helix-turn-helix transcriptional regulator [Gammaproteobacteria bacterium]
MSKLTPIPQMIWHLRRVYQQLTSLSNALLGPFELVASQRAVLEFLDHKEPDTLATMARTHSVSRQHIQQIVNGLQEKGLVESFENPHHRRSFLIRRTPQGRAVFQKIAQREAAIFTLLAQQFDPQAIQQTANTLRAMEGYLDAPDTQVELTRVLAQLALSDEVSGTLY